MPTYDWLHVSNTSFASGTSGGFMPLSGGGGGSGTSFTEAHNQIKSRAAYTLKSAYVVTQSNTRNGTGTVVSRINGVNGNVSVSITASTTGEFSDTTHTDSIASTNLINWSCTFAGSSGSTRYDEIVCVLEETTGTPVLVSSFTNNNTTFGNGTFFTPVGGALTVFTGTEANARYTFRTASVLSNLYVYVRTAAVGTTTVSSRINGAGGTQTVTPALLTGAFEDTTHTDSISVTDTVDTQCASVAGNGSVIVLISYLSTSTSRQTGGAVPTTARTADIFYPLEGSNDSTTENITQAHMHLPMPMTNMYATSNVNARASSATPVFLRQNGASTSVTCSFAASTTGTVEDTTHILTTVADDLLNFIIDVGAGTGNFSLAVLGIEQQASSSTNTTITPGVLSLALSFFTPQLSQTLTPTVLSTTLSFFTPGVSLGQTVTPGVLSLTLSFFTPTLIAGIGVTPAPLSLALTFFTPTVTATAILFPSTLALTLSFFTPTVTGSILITPAPLSLSLGFLTPSLNQTLTPGVLALVTSFFTPILTTTLTPSILSLTLSFFTPTLTQSANNYLTPTLLGLTLSFFTPGIASPQTFIPSVLALILNLFTPTIITVPTGIRLPDAGAVLNTNPFGMASYNLPDNNIGAILSYMPVGDSILNPAQQNGTASQSDIPPSGSAIRKDT